MSLGPLYVLLGEVSVQVLCPFFNWIVCLPGVELYEFFIYFEDQTLVHFIQCFSVNCQLTSIWENILANDTSEKGLISKIYKELT